MFNDTLRPFGNRAYTFNNICQDDLFYYITVGVNNGIIKMDRQFNIVKKRSYNFSSYYYISYPYNSTIVKNNRIVFCAQAKDTF